MARSQMQHQQEEHTLGQVYTHKKFNYDCSHKKLGLPLRAEQCDQDSNKENSTQLQMKQVKTNKPLKGLFRPYALDENKTSRKRKISRPSETPVDNCGVSSFTQQNSIAANNSQSYGQQQRIQLNVDITTANIPNQHIDYNALSPTLYNTRLQNLRVALYMRYMAQIHQQYTPTTLQTIAGYPNVTAPIFNDC